MTDSQAFKFERFGNFKYLLVEAFNKPCFMREWVSVYDASLNPELWAHDVIDHRHGMEVLTESDAILEEVFASGSMLFRSQEPSLFLTPKIYNKTLARLTINSLASLRKLLEGGFLRIHKDFMYQYDSFLDPYIEELKDFTDDEYVGDFLRIPYIKKLLEAGYGQASSINVGTNISYLYKRVESTLRDFITLKSVLPESIHLYVNFKTGDVCVREESFNAG